MPEMNTNQLQTNQEAAQAQQADAAPAYTVEQLQAMQAAQLKLDSKRMSPTQPVSPAVLDAYLSSDNQENPMFYRNARGETKVNYFAGVPKQKAQLYIEEEGAIDVVGRKEALQKTASQDTARINAYARVAYPEFVKDYTGRTGAIRNFVADVGNAIISAPRGFAALPANAVGAVASSPRYVAESKWNQYKNSIDPQTFFNVSVFIKTQMEEAEKAKQELIDSGESTDGDGMYASAQERIFSKQIQSDYHLSDKEKAALAEYKKVVEARDADMRRSLVIKEFSEGFGKDAQESLADLLNLTEEDKMSLGAQLSTSAGEIAGNLAFTYMTGRASGSVSKVAKNAIDAFKGKGYLDFARKARASGAAILAADAAIPAATASQIAFQELSIVPPIFASQFNQMRTEALLAGKDLGEATNIALVGAAAEAGLEFAGFKIFKRFYTKDGWMRNLLLRNLLPEGLQEASQTAAENFITETYGVTDKQWSDIMSEIGFSLMAGMLGGAAFAAGRMRFEGTMAAFEETADRYTKTMALLGSEKAQQAYNIAMDELAFEDWLEEHPEVDQNVIQQKREARAARRAQSQQIEDDVKQAKEDIKEMYKELRDYAAKRAKQLNPNITKKQQQALFEDIKKQVGVALDGNTLTSKYYAAADSVINMYYNKMQHIDKHQARAITKMLKDSGKYTKEQIKAITSSDHIKATNAKLDILEDRMATNLVKQGFAQEEAEMSARFARKLIAPSALINPNFDAVAMSKKLQANVLRIRDAAFYKMEELRDTPFEPVSYRMQNYTADLGIPVQKDYLHSKMIELSKQLCSETDMSEADAERWNQLLYGKKDFDKGLSRTRESMQSQAELIKTIVEHMPTNLNRDLSLEDAGAMWLLNNMGMSWDQVLDTFDIKMKGNRIAEKSFNEVASEFVQKPRAKDMQAMQRMLAKMADDAQAQARTKEASGLYNSDENLIVLAREGKEHIGTAFHEHNHFSMSAILNNELQLDAADLLPDQSLLHSLKDKLAKSMRGARWLTEREFQETLNDALMQYFDSGMCKDTAFTTYFAMMKEKGYKNRVDLFASRLSAKSGDKLDATQQKELQSTLNEVFGAASITDIITQANKLREHTQLKGLPDRAENEGARAYHSRIANSLADELQTMLNAVPVKDADELSREIEKARNENYGAPITQEVFTPGQTETKTETIYNKGNITKLLVLSEQISARALDFAYDVLTAEKSESIGLPDNDTTFYNVATDVISPARQSNVISTPELIENLKQLTPSLEGLKSVINGVVESIKDMALSLEGASGEVSNELRDIIMREVWTESMYRKLFREKLEPIIEARNNWRSKFTREQLRVKEREFQRQFTANLGDGNFTAARKWLASEMGEDVAKKWDDIIDILTGRNNDKAESWMALSDEERKKNPIGYLYKGAAKILAESGVALPNELQSFFPMLVRDYEGLTKQRFGHQYTYSEVDKLKARLREEYLEKMGKVENGEKVLTEEGEKALEQEVAEIINSRMQRNVASEEKVSSFFRRRFKDYGNTVEKEIANNQAHGILDYYFDPFESLDRYMDTVLRTATARHLIGHTVQMSKDGKPMFDHLGSLKDEVNKIRQNKDLSAEDRKRRENELLFLNGKVGLYLATHEFNDPVVMQRFMKSMQAYVSRTSANPKDFFNWMRAVNQVTMLGNIFSALNQITDLQFCFTNFGIKPTAQAFMDVIFNRDGADFVKLEDVYGESSSESFRPSDETPLGKVTRWVFQHSGFEWADIRLKEVTINAVNNYAKDMAQKLKSGQKVDNADFARFDQILNEVIPDESIGRVGLKDEQVEALKQRQAQRQRALLEDMAAGLQTQDVKYVLWYMLNKMQPMNSATVASHYNKTGSFGRLCWQFNTVTARQAGFLYESMMKEKERFGPKGASKYMARFFMMAALVGIPKEILEAFLKGQKPDGYDLALTPFQAMWINQYVLSTFKRQGLAAAATTQFTPKAGVVNNLTKDVYGVVTLNPKGYTVRNVPLVGSFIWNWIGYGRTSAIKQDKALFHHKMTREEYQTKIAKAKENAEFMKTGEVKND